MAEPGGQRVSGGWAARGVAPHRAAGIVASSGRWPVRIAVAGAWWNIAPVARRGYPGNVAAELVGAQSGRVLAQTQAVGRIIEERLGFPLPERVHDLVRRAPAQAFFTIKAQAVRMERIWATPGLRPQVTSDVQLDGRGHARYGDLFEPSIRTWDHDDVEVEIISARSAMLSPGSGSRLTYRVSQAGSVIFAGDDVVIPAGMHPGSAGALQRVAVGPAGEWSSLHFSPRQREFIEARGRSLWDAVSRLADPPGGPALGGTDVPPPESLPPPEDFGFDL